VLRASGCAGLIAVALLWARAEAVQGQAAEQVLLEVAEGACPDATQLEQALQPLLEQGVTLVLEATASTTRRASVEDAGGQYAIEIDGERRKVEDARRDCVERARVAAVFIALNMQMSPARPELPKEPEPPAEPEPEPEEPEAPPLPPGLGASIFALADHSTDAARTTLGAGASLFYVHAPFRFELGAGVLAPIELELDPRDGIRGSARFLRVPLAITASYLLRLSPFELGPTAGLAIDVLHIEGEGQGIERPQTELRLSPGLLAGADFHLWISRYVGLVLRLQMRAFPMVYRFEVEPAGRLGEAPRLWLSGQLGAQARF
jgi:hypothetical protein